MCLLLLLAVVAESAHVHPLSQFGTPIGARLRRSDGYGAILTADPPVIRGSGGLVTLTWSNYLYPAATDWIGLFCPASVSAYTVAPLKFRWLSTADNFNATPSSGSMLFYVMNLRADCKFVLFSGGAQFPLIEAESNTVQVVDYNLPSSVRLSLPTSDGAPAMRVSWSTLNASQPVVKYGLEPGKLTRVAVPETYTYAASDMCTAPAATRGWYAPGSLHTVVLSDLSPGSTYFYTVGDNAFPTDAAHWAPVADFVAPAPAAPAVLLLAFGDMGNAPADGSQQHSWDYDNHGEINALNTTRRLALELDGPVRPAAVVHFGDICYAVGYESEWDQFHEQVRPVASRVPWMVGIGNHEMDVPTSFVPGSDSGGECGVSYSQRFIMPPPAHTRRADSPWYEFIVGPVHIVMMSSEHDFRAGSPQYSFLQHALASVDRERTPWLIFAGHRPMYIDSSWDDGTPYCDQGFARTLRATLEPLLLAAKVDLAMWGHHHSYQRTCAVASTACQPGAPVHVVVGTAGYDLRGAFLNPPPPYTIKALDTFWGYSRIHASRTELTFEFVADVDGSVQDSFVLTHADNGRQARPQMPVTL